MSEPGKNVVGEALPYCISKAQTSSGSYICSKDKNFCKCLSVQSIWKNFNVLSQLSRIEFLRQAAKGLCCMTLAMPYGDKAFKACWGCIERRGKTCYGFTQCLESALNGWKMGAHSDFNVDCTNWLILKKNLRANHFRQWGNRDLGENQGAELFGCIDAPCRSLISFWL